MSDSHAKRRYNSGTLIFAGCVKISAPAIQQVERAMNHRAFRFLAVVLVNLPLASHAEGRKLASAFTQAVKECQWLGGPRGTSEQLVGDEQGDFWFYTNAARANHSRQLWSANGRRFIEAQLQKAKPGMRRDCMNQLLREARLERLD